MIPIPSPQLDEPSIRREGKWDYIFIKKGSKNRSILLPKRDTSIDKNFTEV